MNVITNDFLAANFGSTLLVHIAAGMIQTARKQLIERDNYDDGPRIEQGLENRFVYYAGHDINLLFIRRLLR